MDAVVQRAHRASALRGARPVRELRVMRVVREMRACMRGEAVWRSRRPSASEGGGENVRNSVNRFVVESPK